MRYHVYSDARYIDGEVAAGQTLAVYTNSGAGTAATLYTTQTGSTTAANPYTVPNTGIVDFWLTNPAPYVLAEDDTEARPLPVVSFPSGIINVREFGATGNGTTDDAAAIQAALDAASSGGTVYFPAGTYMVSVPINVLKRVNLIGEHEKDTYLKAATGFSGYFLLRNFEDTDSATADLPTNTSRTLYPHIEHLRFSSGTGNDDLILIGWHGFHETGYIRDVNFYSASEDITPIKVDAIAGGVIRRINSYSAGTADAHWKNQIHADFSGGTDLAIESWYCAGQHSSDVWYFTTGYMLMASHLYSEALVDADYAIIRLHTIRHPVLQDCFFSAQSAFDGMMLKATQAAENGQTVNSPVMRNMVTLDPDIFVGTNLIYDSVQQAQGIIQIPTASYQCEVIRRYDGRTFEFTDHNANSKPRRLTIRSSGFYEEDHASAAPTTGTWTRGSLVHNTAPSASGTMGWVCTEAGTPGTWKTFGAIEA